MVDGRLDERLGVAGDVQRAGKPGGLGAVHNLLTGLGFVGTM